MASGFLTQAGPSSLPRPLSKIYRSPKPGFLSKSPLSSSRPSICRSRAPFSTSTRASAANTNASSSRVSKNRETHYETLGISSGASRMEIKAAYFRLSKRYHPDVRRSVHGVRKRGNDGKDEERLKERDVEIAKEKEESRRDTERFHEVSAAYRVLSDDRQRRAYDRSLSTIPSSPVHRASRGAYGSHTPGSSSSYAYTYEMHTRRRHSATHAWEGTGSRASANRTHPQHSHGRHYDPSSTPSSSSASSPFSQYTASSSHSSPSASPSSFGANTNTATRETRLSGKELRAEEERAAHDRLASESSIGRFLRALGIVLVVSWIGGIAGR